ncbi:hypothetical protein SEPCBS119000_004648 [Sporothrix epigloea]|uniref:Mid2 domain-containing protein n=1 Tax=Sporothrix epigloea TaxID=1892477 RepID=A0ABP0DTG2_9PEZI
MYSQRLVKLLFVALSFVVVAQALKLDTRFFHIGNNAAVRRAEKSGTETSKSTPKSTGVNNPPPSSAPPSVQASSTPAKASSTPPPPPSSTATTSPTSKSTPAQTSTPTTHSTASTESKPATSSKPATTSSKTKTTSQTTKAPGSTTYATKPVSTSTFLTTVTKSDGSTTAVETVATTTPTSALSSSQGDHKTSGMSTQTRNIIIGVVVGVGGAVIIAVLGLVALRIRRQKQAARDGNGLNDYDPNYGNVPVGALEKTDGGPAAAGGAPGRSPFQSTLESYHTSQPVNTASNF